MSETTEYIPLTLWIAERSYRIKAKKEEEEAIRIAVKIADEKIMELRRSFAGKDDQDFLAMCLILYVTDQVTESDSLDPVTKRKISNLIDDIKQVL